MKCHLCEDEFVGGKGKRYCSPECYAAANIEEITDSGCWIWRGSSDRQGYKQAVWDWVKTRAHRFMFKLVFGPLADDMVVRHKCDNPPCCNPDHLLSGTPQDNTNDMMERDRFPIGSRHYRATIGEEEARLIFNAPAHLPAETLAAQYGTTKGAVRNIRAGLTWRHATGA